jgi:hypothetical protein
VKSCWEWVEETLLNLPQWALAPGLFGIVDFAPGSRLIRLRSEDQKIIHPVGFHKIL